MLDDITIKITVSPDVVHHGDSTLLQWAVVQPIGNPPLKIRLNEELVTINGSRLVTPPRRTKFTISVSRPPLPIAVTKSVEVTVLYNALVVIDKDTQDPAQVLVGALTENQNCEQTVELNDVDVDLTGFQRIVIGKHTSLIASLGCERGPRRLGPRIFVTDPRGGQPLFIVEDDCVRISGFRLEGPTKGVGTNGRKEKGILISPIETGAPVDHIEISNMDISHWAGVGVEVIDNPTNDNVRGRLFNTNPDGVHIFGSFFHSNRHQNGAGYGVSVREGAFALIEKNVFNNNRHAIAGGSRHDKELDFSGYLVRENLILEAGGRHCRDKAAENALAGATIGGIIGGIVGGIVGGILGGPPGVAGGAAIGVGIGGAIGGGIGAAIGSYCWWTHQIDMHGDHDGLLSVKPCGTAGETLIIERNTILYTAGHAIKIRGNPADKAVVDGNVFKLQKDDGPIAQNGTCGFWGDNITNPIDVRPNNQFGKSPRDELGTGDFVGDGVQEQFMATGVTWWVKSPVTRQWRHLNTMSERLPQLLLQRADGDAVFDVVLLPSNPKLQPTLYSKGGTTPWIPIPITVGGTAPPVVIE